MFWCSLTDLIAGRPTLLRSYGSCGARVQTFALVAIALALALPVRAPAVADQPVRIVALGDSLTAGLGLPADRAFPARLERALKAKGLAVEVTNAGVSGDTASGGLARLDWSVPEGTDAVIVELGANDMLRGIDIAIRGKARVVNMSLAGTSFSLSQARALEAAFLNDVLPVAAAGNHGDSGNPLEYPAALLGGVMGSRGIGLSVGATMPNGQAAGFAPSADQERSHHAGGGDGSLLNSTPSPSNSTTTLSAWRSRYRAHT